MKVKEIWQANKRTLGIKWSDDKKSLYDVVSLRRKCPCAECIDEMTGERRLKDQDVSDHVRPLKIDSVGNYALKISFNDGHKTGIYTFDKLREIH